MSGLETADGGGANGIQAVSRSGQILRLFSLEQRTLRVAEAAARLNLQRPTVHRYMASLATEGLLEREADGSYRIGPVLRQLGMTAVGGLDVVKIAGPYMQRLVAEAGETTVLSLWGGHGPVVARVQEDTTRLVHVSVRIGSALPLDSAQGQAFLGHLPDRTLVARLLGQLSALQRQHLERQVEAGRRTGVAVNSRVVEGIRALAAPVFDQDALICATLAVVGTVAAIPDDPTSGIAQALVQTARELSLQLGCPRPAAGPPGQPQAPPDGDPAPPDPGH
jgi:DNA-binding IclR family transcriptional regulator